MMDIRLMILGICHDGDDVLAFSHDLDEPKMESLFSRIVKEIPWEGDPACRTMLLDFFEGIMFTDTTEEFILKETNLSA